MMKEFKSILHAGLNDTSQIDYFVYEKAFHLVSDIFIECSRLNKNINRITNKIKFIHDINNGRKKIYILEEIYEVEFEIYSLFSAKLSKGFEPNDKTYYRFVKILCELDEAGVERKSSFCRIYNLEELPRTSSLLEIIDDIINWHSDLFIAIEPLSEFIPENILARIRKIVKISTESNISGIRWEKERLIKGIELLTQFRDNSIKLNFENIISSISHKYYQLLFIIEKTIEEEKLGRDEIEGYISTNKGNENQHKMNLRRKYKNLNKELEDCCSDFVISYKKEISKMKIGLYETQISIYCVLYLLRYLENVNNKYSVINSLYFLVPKIN